MRESVSHRCFTMTPVAFGEMTRPCLAQGIRSQEFCRVEGALFEHADLRRRGPAKASPEQFMAIRTARALRAPLWLVDMPEVTQVLSTSAGWTGSVPNNLKERDAYMALSLLLRVAQAALSSPDSPPLSVAFVAGCGHMKGVAREWDALIQGGGAAVEGDAGPQIVPLCTARLRELSALPRFPCSRADAKANNAVAYLLCTRCRSSADVFAVLEALPAAVSADDLHYSHHLLLRFQEAAAAIKS